MDRPCYIESSAKWGYNRRGIIPRKDVAHLKDTVYIDVASTDPAFNLALEQYVFDQLPRDRQYFLFWQNDNAVIIGKHQNTLAEINESYIREHGIRVVRRLSGGGAVYHDLGNLNFTWITDAGQESQIDLKRFCQPVADALRSLGADAQVSGRNDILISGQKISGNSQYVRENRIMHHGTLLFDSDLSILGNALNVDPSKIQAKGIQSVRSRVSTIRPHLQKDISLADFKALLLEHLFPDGVERYALTETDIAAIEELRTQRYGTWEWNYGASPACSLLRKQRIEGCGTVEAHIQLEKGRITAVTFLGDFFSTVEPENLASRLTGLRLTESDCRPVLEAERVSDYFNGATAEDLLSLLCGS